MRGSKLATAVTYANNQKPYMENYLLDGRCSISNNAAENAIRPFVMGRKNWLFADTSKGADALVRIHAGRMQGLMRIRNCGSVALLGVR